MLVDPPMTQAPDNLGWTRAEIAACVVATLRDVLGLGEELGPDADLRAAGLDSLTLTQLLLAIEERIGVWIDESRLTPENLASPGALAACIHEQMVSGQC